MNYDELNEYIKHYIEEDITKSAIMLTGAWGTGKSYYIHNVLEPFLKENGKHRCAVVSLYGLKNTSEISKRIYFELRTIGFAKKSEAISTTKVAATIIAKTVLNGMTNMIGFDIGKTTDEDLEEVYSSIDLSNVLVVFEDLERSNIDVIDILGYVNSLVEQDGANVLLVANEDEILKCCDDENRKNAFDESIAGYLRAKEKTVSDTIFFKDDHKSAIKNIICSFNNIVLKRFMSDDNINCIINILNELQNYNLRSFIFACQKTVDIYKRLDNLNILENYFVKTIFYSIIAFSTKIKSGKYPEWMNSELISEELGFVDFPLYRFCYDYIRWQHFNLNEAQDAFSEHTKFRLHYKINIDEYDNKDKDFCIVSDYLFRYVQELKSSLESIKNRLLDPMDIPFVYYERLAYYFIKCNSIFEYDYSLCKERMICNIQKYGNELDTELFYWKGNLYVLENANEEKQYFDFSRDFVKAIRTVSRNIYDISYVPEDVDRFYEFFSTNKKPNTHEVIYISGFDLDKLVNMLIKCSPNQLNHFRSLLVTRYQYATKRNYSPVDFEFMNDLKSKLENEKELHSSDYDKVQLLQLNNLIGDLEFLIGRYNTLL